MFLDINVLSISRHQERISMGKEELEKQRKNLGTRRKTSAKIPSASSNNSNDGFLRPPDKT